MIRILLFLSVSLMTLFSCQRKKNNDISSETEETSFKGYIPPAKLDSMLSENFLLNSFYTSDNEQKEFSFHTPIASAKIYENIIDEKGKSVYSDYPEHLLSEVFFTKSGKLSSYENVNRKSKFIVIYNSKNLVNFYIRHEFDNIMKEEKIEITEYKYDGNGNLISEYKYKKKPEGFELWHYTEYKYSFENGNIIVQKNLLEKFANYYFNKSKLTFDSKKRLIKEENYSQNVLARGREITSEENYYYENSKFPAKVTKIQSVATTDGSSQTETFQYDQYGNLIEYVEATKPEIYITTKKNNYLAKNKIESINEHKTLKSYQAMGVQVDPDEQRDHTIVTSDDMGNILLKENVKNKSEKNYLSYKYIFDNHKNWIEKLVKEHTYIPKEYLNEDVREDAYIKYRREINYSDFKESIPLKKIDLDAAEKFKNEILEQQKFYETFKNLK
ncbi:hypothetical protein ACLB9Y_00215 [Chryseobacterium scophthalmum]|uniref:hypothetical protein n=1 Tax=Chryseobacterium scophthalmum TaxID=59733 RepID=UPI00398AE2A2